MSDQVLALITRAGAPALFGILILTSAGAPFPDTLLLLAVGSFVAQGEIALWQALVFGIAGAILGDQLGYFAGLYGGRPLVRRITGKLGLGDKVKSAEDFMKRWGGAGIFFTRWLIGPLGPWVNLSSGIAGYSWGRFLFWDVLGEVLWVCLFVGLGDLFSDRVQALASELGNFSWFILGAVAAGFLGWKLLESRKAARPPENA